MATKLVQSVPFLIAFTFKLACLLSLALVVACSGSQPATQRSSEVPSNPETTAVIQPLPTEHREIKLLDDNSLDGWEIANFGGEGECWVKDGELVVEMGYPLSGVTSTRKDLPTNNYEISLEAKRTQGIDFFCGLTFPVNDSYCTLIVGGWAGAVVGLSCVDEQDAAHNETKKIMNFDDDRWYSIRVKVGDTIEAWIDNEPVVDVATASHRFSLRGDTLVTRPLGICTFDSAASYRNIVVRDLSAEMEPANMNGR